MSLFAPAIAPTLGGLILQFWGWNWIFLAALPLLLVILVVAALFLDNVTEPRTDRLDLGSVVLSLVGFGGLLLGLGNLDLWPAQPGFIGVSLLLGGFGLVGFVARQMTLPNPLLNLRVFEYRQFSLAMIFVFVSIVSVFGLTMLTPMALGQVWGLGTAAAGLAMLPGGLLNGFTAPLFGKLYDQFGPRGLAIAGSVAMVGAMGALVFLPATAPFWFYIGLHVLFLLGTSSVMTVNQANGVNTLPQRLFPHGTAVMSTLMQLGGGVGTALYISVLASGHAKPAVEAFQGTFLWGAALLLVPLVTSFFVKKSVHPER